jgi:type IV pilus assembly protein PilV
MKNNLCDSDFNTIRFSKGVGLIEVLIAMFVLAIGLLGVAGMQLVSMQNNNSALMRTQAAQLSYEIIDRIRANPDQDYSVAMATAPVAPSDCVGAAANCSASQMKDFDLAEWKCSLGAYFENNVCTTMVTNGSLISVNDLLPEGNGSVAVNGDTHTITVQWNDVRAVDGNGDPLLASYQLIVDL